MMAPLIRQIYGFVASFGVAMEMLELSSEGFETTFATNHLGHFYLFQSLLPMLKMS
jgi:NAD(P)-dependent dehydrogenase (short-subunit alcohol dehydrogenase family)